MKGYITHRHSLTFAPRNELTEEQAELMFKQLQHIPSAKIDNNYTTHIEITWEEQVLIER